MRQVGQAMLWERSLRDHGQPVYAVGDGEDGAGDVPARRGRVQLQARHGGQREETDLSGEKALRGRQAGAWAWGWGLGPEPEAMEMLWIGRRSWKS